MELVSLITPSLQAILQKLYEDHERIDIAIESILEGQQGGKIKLWVDNIIHPSVSMIAHGSFIRFAGIPEDSKKAIGIISNLNKPFFVQPSPTQWIRLLEIVYRQNLQKTKRYKFSSTYLSESHLASVLKQSPWKDAVQRLNKQHVEKLYEDEWGKYHFMNCTYPDELVEKGMAYCIQIKEEIVSCCSSVLVSSDGYEVNIITKPGYRKQGMAKAVAARFLIECLAINKEPHWDAANDSSKQLALQLGYEFSGEYELYYVK